MTKTIKVSESVHNKVKLHVIKNKKGITEFADKALLNQIKADKLKLKSNDTTLSNQNSK